MSAIAGYIDFNGHTCPDSACRKLLSYLSIYGPDEQRLTQSANVCFGHALRRVLPEDAFDRQPLIGCDGRYLLAADVRVDNREELASAIGIGRKALETGSDSTLLMAAWEKWQLNCFDHLLGDCALSIWDARQACLTLARSPGSLRPLFYHIDNSRAAFASLPSALHRLDGIEKQLSVEGLARVAAGYPYQDSLTVFEGICLVRQGQAVEIRRDSYCSRSLWNLRIEESRFRQAEDYGALLRNELERAVAAQMRRFDGEVAAHLSCGRDSSAVAATAARLLDSHDKLIAATAAPREGFEGPAFEDRIVDESPLAARTARAHENVVHLICRPTGTALQPLLDKLHKHHYGPILNPVGLPWWDSVNRTLTRHDASVLLIGSTGNLSISAGGLAYLPDLRRRKGWPSWWSEARKLGGFRPSAWARIAKATIGPAVPANFYSRLLALSGRGPRTISLPMLREPLRNPAEGILTAQLRDLRPPKSGYLAQVQNLMERENSQLFTSLLWGLDMRDPTADRRLLEFCLSLPPEQLVSTQTARPAYEAAFRDRIPGGVLRNSKRGYQVADWFEIFTLDEVRAAFHLYRRSPAVREMLDLDYINSVMDTWPNGGWEDPRIVEKYRHELIGTLSLASFLHVHFPV